MNRRTGFLAALAAILLLLSTLPSAFAQDRDDYGQDPPARAGRIGYTHGSVSFQPGGQGDWLDAVPNRPLTSGDNLWADRDSRAEVQIGSTSVRLSSETSMTILDLDSNVTQLRLSMGSLFFRVRHVGSDDTFEVDTPNLAFNVTQPGEYRIDVNESGDQTTAVVWHGDAEITGGGSSYRLTEGQQGTFAGVDQLRYDVGEIARVDDFSRWCLDRDRHQEQIRSAQYVSADVTGYEDLDEYGRWYDDPQYGHVWAPVGVAYDWAPYRYGHWVYVSPWGWTWVEDEPWGFAPFHYGRWAYLHHGWCWVPGPVVAVPVYSPALVAFVGGGGFSMGIGVGGGVGWFPLAPGEVFVPWYRTSPRYVQNVNVTNTRVTVVQVTNVYNNVTVNRVNNLTYINQRQGRGITVVNQQTFVNAQPVNNHIIRVNEREIQRAPVTHEVVRNIQPERQSVIGTARPVRFAPPQTVMTRPVVATRQPVMVNRVAPVSGIARETAPPPVRTVHPVPPGQAQPLQRGEKGATPGFGRGPVNATAPAGPNNNRGAGPENNRGANAPYSGQQPRPGASETTNPSANRPGASVPRPGGTQMPPQSGESVPRGQNFPTNPNVPDGGRVNAPANNGVRGPASPDMNRPNGVQNGPSNIPENNHPMRNVPRPGRPEQPGVQPQQPQGNSQPEQPRSNVRRNPTPETPQSRPEPNVNSRPTPPEPRQATPMHSEQPVPVPQENRPQVRPDYRPAPAENRNAAPVQSQPMPRPLESRPEPPPQSHRDVTPASPPPRSEPAPRPESHSTPAPQNESRPAEKHQDKGTPDHERDKDHSHFR